MGKRIVNYLPTILVAGLITYLSLLRQPHLPIINFSIAHIDKLVHALMYCAFAFVFSFDLHRANIRKIAIIAILTCTIYGGILELLQQYFFPPRTGEWLDFAADFIGATVGYLIFLGAKYYKDSNGSLKQ